MDLFKDNTLATWCEELTHLKRPWCWEWLKAGGEGDDRGWDGWMASPTQWTWVWVNSGSWWWTGRPGMLWFMGSQRLRHDWATKLNWTEGSQRYCKKSIVLVFIKNYLYPEYIIYISYTLLQILAIYICMQMWLIKQKSKVFREFGEVIFHSTFLKSIHGS